MYYWRFGAEYQFTSGEILSSPIAANSSSFDADRGIGSAGVLKTGAGILEEGSPYVWKYYFLI